MTPAPKGPERPLPEINPGDRSVAPALPVNPRLSANLNADYHALQNDMEQAQELAADFQRQLAGKSNEFAQLKQLFEKTQTDLASLQSGIVELRAERHHLANEAMRSAAFQAKLKKVSEERDRLRIDVEIVRKALAQSADQVAAVRRERNAEFAAIVIELVTLREALAEARRQSPGNGTRATPQSVTPGYGAPPQATTESAGSADDPIEIHYGT